MGDAIYYCLTDKGWEVQITWDGGVTAGSDTIPAAQKDAYLADALECGELVNDRQANLTDDEKAALYAAELEERDCLNSLGYEVEEAPSLQTYLDTYSTTAWTAFDHSGAIDAAPSMSEDEWKELNTQCPQPQWLIEP